MQPDERGPLLGWNIYTGISDDTMTFREFIPTPYLDAYLKVAADELVAEIEGNTP